MATLKEIENPAIDKRPIHVKHDDGVTYFYTIDGCFWSNKLESAEDIIAILPPAKVKKAGKKTAKDPMVDLSQDLIREAIESAQRTIFLLKSLLKP